MMINTQRSTVLIIVILVMLLTGTSHVEAQMQTVDNPQYEYSLVDIYDLTQEIFIGLSNDDMLGLFILSTVDQKAWDPSCTLEEYWEEIKPALSKETDSVWQPCSNGSVEPLLVFAAKKGFLSFVKYVLENTHASKHEISVLAQALHGAVMYGHVETAHLLLDYKADPNGYALTKILYPTSTLDAHFGGFFVDETRTNIDYDLTRRLLISGALFKHEGRKTEIIETQKEYFLQNPELMKIYLSVRLFNSYRLSLYQYCLLHFVLNRNAEIILEEDVQNTKSSSSEKRSRVPAVLVFDLIKSRETFDNDPLLNTKN